MKRMLTMLCLAVLAGCDTKTPVAAECPAAETSCANRCADLRSDPRNCGACGTACAGAELCVDGRCERVCPEGQSACAERCVALASSAEHCGACGHACGDGEVCVDATCTPLCPPATKRCGESCRDLLADRSHCGSCGNACLADEVCAAGHCELFCPAGTRGCDGACRDTRSDREHCGGCDQRCGAEEFCVDGACTRLCQGFATTLCGDGCTNTDVDPAHCGTCDTACAPGQACINGTCGDPIGCFPPKALCGASCTLPEMDPANCGGCGNVCRVLAHADSVCLAGECAVACGTPFADCNGDLHGKGSDGCETNLHTSLDHCGACGASCRVPNAAVSCDAGSCSITQCNAGFEDCDQLPGNGCEAELASDRQNCGGCGVTCALGEACLAGHCAVSGEDCASLMTLQRGENLLNWNASRLDYLTAAPSCSTSAADGPDLVMSFEATVAGPTQFVVRKPAGQRWHLVASERCGAVAATAPGHACVSDQTATVMSLTVQAVAGTTYFLHLVDTTQGNLPLSNPLAVKVVAPLDCAVGSARLAPVSPVNGAAVASLAPTLVLGSDAPLDKTQGTFTLTGSSGKVLSYPVSASAVTFAEGDTLVTIVVDSPFQHGETVTVTWSDVKDATCAKAAPVTAWTFTVPVASCTPGVGGMVGTTSTRLPSGLSSMYELYVAADADPNGYLYVGGYGSASTGDQLYRIPKAGGTVQNIYTASDLGAYHLGYAMLVDGASIYTLEETATAQTNRLWRLSNDGGATWRPQNMARFATLPGDGFYAAAAQGGRIFLVTRETDGTADTEIWSLDPAAPTLPAQAVLERSFGAGRWGYCSGLAVTSTRFYTHCRSVTENSVWAIIAVDRARGTVTELTRAFGSTIAPPTPVALHAVDHDHDGAEDVLYLQTGRREVYHVCLGGSTPWADLHVTFNPSSSTTNHGLAYDSGLNALWVFDDSNRDFVRIQ